MHAERPVDKSCFHFIDLKTLSIIAAYITILSHAGIMVKDYLTTEGYNFTIIDVDDMDYPIKPFLFVESTNLLISLIFIIIFTILLLICLYIDYHCMYIDMTFSCLIMTMSAVCSFMWEFVFIVNPTATIHKVLILAINVVYLFVIKCFWNRAASDKGRLEEYA